MKIQNILPWKHGISYRSLLLITGTAASMCLSSCVVPYDTYSGGYSNPQPGYRVLTLPNGYRSESISGNTYYYQNGTYYRRDTAGYVVIDAPRSSRYYDDYSRSRESNQRDHRYDQQTHDYQDNRDDRHEHGDVLTQLPYGHRVITYQGTRYYQVGERYYVRQNNGYVQVRRPY